MKHLPGTTALLRPLLALLTVVAAFMFPLRITALGQLNPIQAGSMAHTGHRPATSTGHIGHAHHQAQTTLPGQPPEPPQPASHDHSAHCPFCLTNAFGLEAGISGLPQGPPDDLPTPQPQLFRVYLAVFNTPDARAPPVL